jgi:hypothetical protein
MPHPLKQVTQLQIETALANALSELTGSPFTINIESFVKMDRFSDRHEIKLIASGKYSELQEELEEMQSRKPLVGSGH